MTGGALDQNVNYYLEPGYIYFTRVAATIRTVVGSCIAVCLWDSNLKYGGMNHFLHPVMRDARKATPRYGNVATAALVHMMQQAGCQTRDLVAQILGGALPTGAHGDHIGVRNADIARTILTRKGIKVASEDIGGNMGRKVVFDTGTGQLVTLKVHELRDANWVEGLTLAGCQRLGALGGAATGYRAQPLIGPGI